MLAEVFTYDPNTVDPECRERMANILSARAEYLRATADVATLRARTWSGTAGLESVAELNAANLAKLRREYVEQVVSFLKDSVDLEELKQLVPIMILGALRNLKVPLPILMESLGVDLDNLMTATEQFKGFFSDM